MLIPPSNPHRLDWHETWYEVAKTIAARSLCVRDQIGAVIVDGRNRIIATGYNGPPAGFDHQNKLCTEWCWRGANGPTEETARSYTDCPNLHAEANAIAVCDRAARVGGTMYVTSSICFTCAKLIANSGLTRVIIPVTNEHTYRQAAASNKLLTDCGITVVEMHF